MHVPEEAGGRPRRVGRSAQATNAAKSTAKSIVAKLGAPPTVGLPKPPQIFAKVRELVFVCQSLMISFACRRTDQNKCKCTQCMYYWYLE